MRDVAARNNWTDERIEQLRIWRMVEGRSAGQIAKAFGPSVTRNAVIGKCVRMGFMLPSSPSAPKIPGRGRGGAEWMNKAQLEIAVDAAKKRLSTPARPAVVVEFRIRPCKWPLGDPNDADFHFCGAASKIKADGENFYPYCADHCAIAYRDTPGRRDLERSVRRYA